MQLPTLGKWIFIAGLALSVIAGIFFQSGTVFWGLAVLGVIIGFLNIFGEDTHDFLLAGIAILLSATALNTIPLVGGLLKNILGYMASFVAAAMIVVALKALYVTAKQKPH
jgi:hypothetical protein